MRISTGVTYKTSSRNEFRENKLGDSHTLFKAATTFIAVLATFLDPQVSNSIEKINMQFRKTAVNVVRIGAVKPRLYYIKWIKHNFALLSKFFSRFEWFGTDIWLRARQPRNRGSIPCRWRKPSSPSKCPAQLLDPTSLLFNGYLERVPEAKKGQNVNLTNHCRLVPRLKWAELHLHSLTCLRGVGRNLKLNLNMCQRTTDGGQCDQA